MTTIQNARDTVNEIENRPYYLLCQIENRIDYQERQDRFPWRPRF